MREHEESVHDADSNHEVPNVEPKDELDTWVDFTVRATHTAIGLKWNQSWTIRQRRNFWTQARVMAKNTEDIGQSFLQLYCNDTNQAEREHGMQGRPAKRDEDINAYLHFIDTTTI